MWNLHTNNLVGQLRGVTYKFAKLKDVLPIETVIYVIHTSRVLSIDNLMWPSGLGRCKKQQYKKFTTKSEYYIVRIILNKKTPEGSTKINYEILGGLPIRLPYRVRLLFFNCIFVR